MTVALIVVLALVIFCGLHTTSDGRLFLPAFRVRGERWRIRAGRSRVRWLLSHKMEKHHQGRVHLILIGPVLIVIMIDPVGQPPPLTRLRV
jgi:hypothetical protein